MKGLVGRTPWGRGGISPASAGQGADRLRRPGLVLVPACSLPPSSRGGLPVCVSVHTFSFFKDEDQLHWAKACSIGLVLTKFPL